VVAFNSAGLWRCGWGAPSGANTYLWLSRCCVYGNTAFNVRFESSPSGQPNPSGTADYISADPLFADVAAGNWRLTNVSPCVNAGSNEFVAEGATDADGLTRIVPVGGTVDMGAYELRPEPVALRQTVTTDEDTPATITLDAWDADGDPLTYEIVAGPAHGTLSGSLPSLVYTPDPNYFGSDLFTFRAHDGTAPSTAAAVTLTVTPVNDPPTVTSLTLSAVCAGRDALLTAVLADIDDETLTVTINWGDGTAPQNLAAGTGSFSATHVYATSGEFTVTFEARDPGGLCTEAGATVDVPAAEPPGTVHYVNWNNPAPTYPYTSWETAARTVQAAINVTGSGNEVWVAAGTYEGTLHLLSGVALYGGFVGTESNREDRNWTLNQTTLHAKQRGRVVTVADAANDRTRIDGFTITGGRAERGGGLYVSPGAAPAVENNIVTSNTADLHGGGFYCYYSSPTLTRNLIRGNTATTGQGGGGFTAGASPVMRENTFSENTAGGYGGGALSLRGNTPAPLLENNDILNNSGGTHGGGIIIFNGNGVIQMIGNRIMGNTAALGSGGGICVMDLASVTHEVRGNTISGNTAKEYGGGVFCHTSPLAMTGNVIGANGTGLKGNESGWDGGGLYFTNGSQSTLTGNTISGNKARSGGGVFVTASTVTLGHDTITGNHAESHGGGVYMDGAANVAIDNGTFLNNSSSTHAGALAVTAGCKARVDDCLFGGNQAVIYAGAIHVIGIGAEATLAHCTLSSNQAGPGIGWGAYGGGLFVEQTATVKIVGSSLEGNTASSFGGALSVVSGCTVEVADSLLVNNSAGGYGGALQAYDSVVRIAGSTVLGNTAENGGALALYGGQPVLVTNSLLSGNSAAADGGAVITGAPTTVVNCTVTGNMTAAQNGATLSVGAGQADLHNTVIAFNDAGIRDSSGSGGATISLSHCCVYGNTRDNYLGVDDPTGTDGNVSADPLFADAAAGNWRLTNVSPCVNAGSNEFVAEGATDADGLSRIVPVGGTVDMGAYELRDAAPVAVAQSITLPEDGAATVVLTAWDVDNDPLTYEIVAGPAHGSLSGSLPSLVYTPDPNYFGSDLFTFQAHDGTAPSTAAAVTLTVTPVNDAPEVVGLWVPAVNEGGETTLAATLGDVDDLSLAVTVTWGDGSAAESFAAGTGTFAATHLYAASGTFTVGIQVRDAAGLSATASASVRVANVAPSVTLGGGGTLSEGDAFVGSGSFADPGTDTWSATVDYGDGSGSQALELDGSGFLLEHTYLDQGTYAVTVTVTDSDGDSGSATATVVVLNVAPSVTAGSCGAINEGDTFVTSGSFTDPGVNDTWSATVDYGDGSGVQEVALDGGAFLLEHTYLNQGTYTVTVTVTDDDGGSGSDVIVVDVANVTPVIESILAPIEPLAVGLLVEASATFFDPGLLDDHTAMWTWGDGETSTATLWPQGEGQYLVTGEHVYQTPGVYTVTLDVLDDGDTSADDEFRYVVIYDAEGGFVTGGGWILSPEGAFAPDPTLTGKATFGFVAKYKKGQQIPSGQTQFDFAVAGLSFHSTAYAWLVVAGPQAKYKGTGTINGSAGFGFMLTARDGQRSGGGGVDQFRIKIWEEVTGEVVYDNQMGADDDSSAATALGGGSIVIHDK
jgi:hypothetical protein